MSVLWLCGPRGVGKSTVGWEVYMRLWDVRTAYIDLRQLGISRPAPADDPDNHRFTARNLDALWRAHRESGARRLVVSGGVGEECVLPGAFVCVLRASREVLVERLLMRGRGEGPAVPADDLRGLPGERLRELAVPSAVEGFGVDTDGLAVAEVADAVLAAFRSTPGA
jgi:AAA domain